MIKQKNARDWYDNETKMVDSKKKMMTFCICLVAALGVILSGAAFSQVEKVVFDTEKRIAFNDNWQVAINGVDEGIIELPHYVDAKKNDRLVLETMLPERLGVNASVCFRSSQKFVKIFVGNELIYSFGYETKQLFGKSPGSAWHIVRLPVGATGEPIRIEMVTPYHNYAGNVNEVYIGTKASLIYGIFNSYIWGALISFLVFVVGVLMLTSQFFVGRGVFDRSIFYLSAFTILTALWSGMESKLVQLVWGNMFVVSIIAFLSLALMPIAFVLFLLSTERYCNDKVFRMLFYLFVANFAVINILQFLNVADYIESLVGTLGLIFLGIGYMLSQFVRKLLKHDPEEKFTIVEWGFLILSVFSLLDFINLCTLSFSDTAFFFRIGTMGFIIALGVVSIKQAIVLYSQEIENDAFKTLAYFDTMTQLHNRTAFEEKLNQFREETADEAVLVVFDLNDLKMINDSYGHIAGDEAIMTIAKILKECIGEIGICFRIGGDEFCAICDGVSDQAIDQLMQEVQIRLKETNMERPIKLAVAYGYARYSKSHQDIDKVFTQADHAMYVCKAQMKGRYGKRRRDDYQVQPLEVEDTSIEVTT